MTADPSAPAHPAFRQAEKHFKNRATSSLPALRGIPADICAPVLDLSRPENEADDEVFRAGWWGEVYAPRVEGRRRRSGKGKARALGERPPMDESRGMRRIEFGGRVGYVVAEGCVLLPNYLSPETQLDLLLRSLGSYTLPPNPLSLSTHYTLPPYLFALYVSSPETPVRPRHMDFDEAEREAHGAHGRARAGPRSLIETAPAATVGYDEVRRRNAQWTGDPASLKLSERSVDQLMREIRWANLGWVYQWSTKSYDFSTSEPIPFPPELADICRGVVRDIPWAEVYPNSDAAPDWHSWGEDYMPDTGIVNYYQRNDTLMAHVDRSELDPSRPLVSLSLGHAAVFLLGADSREHPPTPIVLRSGDVLVMSGRGRQAYHGVPRIMEDTLPQHFDDAEGDSPEMAAAKRWIRSARVNINARQVFPRGFTIPETEAGANGGTDAAQ